MIGDIWECDECTAQFKVVGGQRQDGDFRETWWVNTLEWDLIKHGNNY